MNDVRVHEHTAPDERLGRISQRLLGALEADPEYDEHDRLIVMLTEPRQGGAAMIAMLGYEPGSAAEDASGDLFQHLRALVAGQGGELHMERRGSTVTVINGQHPAQPESGAVVTVTITDRKDGITALVESKPPLPLTDDLLDVDRATNAQAAAIHMLWQIGEQTENFDWRTVAHREQP